MFKGDCMRNKKIILLFTMIFCMMFLVACNPNSEDEYYYRDVCKNDVIITQKSTELTTFYFYVRPQVDIDGLYIDFAFFDADGKPVIAAGKKIGNVKDGGEYTIDVTFDDLSLLQVLKIKTFKTWFSQGKIKVEQDMGGLCFNHKFDDGVKIKNETCGEAGEKVLTCKNCHYKKTQSIAMEDHDFVVWQFSSKWEICTKCAIRQKA